MKALLPNRQSPPPPDPTSSKGEAEMVDLEEIVRDYAVGFLDNDLKKHADVKNCIINWDRMFVTYDKAVYSNPVSPPMPASHVLFSALFSNNTPKPQTYALRTERRTKSSCTISFSKTFAYGVNINLRLSPPTPVVEANSGFKSDLSQTKGQSQTFERELTWSVDNNIAVPAGFQTKAELVIKEDDYNGNFEVPCHFEGSVSVTFENKKHEHVSTVREHVKKIFAKQKGFTVDESGRPMFVVRGCCNCRFGIEQSVRLTELPLPEEEKSPAVLAAEENGTGEEENED